MSQEIKDFQCATAERILHIYKNLGHLGYYLPMR